MKCPLLGAHTWTDDEGVVTMTGDCLKEECAWWDSSQEQCALLIAATHLVALVAVVDLMLEKIRK